MANIAGTNIASAIRPFTTDDKFPVALMNEIQGGFHSVESLSTVDTELPLERRQEGMWIKVKDEDKVYEWKLNTDETPVLDWIEVLFSSEIPSITVTSIEDFDLVESIGLFEIKGEIIGLYIGKINNNKFDQMVIYDNSIYIRTIDLGVNPIVYPDFEEKYLKSSDVENTIIEDSENPVAGGAVFTALEGKEDKNIVVNNFYITNIIEFKDALAFASDSNLPTSIFIGGTVTLTEDLYFPGTKQIKVTGQPLANINLAGYKLTGSALNFENIIFLNPSQYGYLFTTNGNARINNCYFHTDNIDTNGAIPHITISALTGTSTGLISLDGIRHQTNSYSANSNPSILIQPINIVVDYPGYVNLFIEINNVSAVSGFERFSRVLINANYASTIRVSGDESWFYAPEQEMPGEGHINLGSILKKNSSADNFYLSNTQQQNDLSRSVTIDDNNLLSISPKSVIRVPDLASLISTSFWESINISPFIEMVVSVYEDGDNNGLYSLKNIFYTNISSWEKNGSSVDSFPTNYITSIEEIDAQVAPSKSGVLLSEDYLDWGTRFFTLLTLPYGGGDVNVSQMAISFSPDSESTPTLHSRWGAYSELVNNGEPSWTPWKSITGTGGTGDMLKSIYDTNNDGIVDKAKGDENGLDISTGYNKKITNVTVINYWQDETPIGATAGKIWYNPTDKIKKAYAGNDTWYAISISQNHVQRFENKFYSWTGSDMVLISDGDTSSKKVDRIVLLSITTEPNDFSVGDKYFNSTDKKIWTAVNQGGEPLFNIYSEPTNGIIYIFGGSNYLWDGTNLIEVGSGNMLKSTYDPTSSGVVLKAKSDQNGLNISTGYNKKISGLIIIHFWQDETPTGAINGNFWYHPTNKVLKSYSSSSSSWVLQPLFETDLKRFENKFYLWNGSGMILISDADAPITSLKDGVDEGGNTLKKLYNLIVSSFTEVTVADIAERNSYDITKLPTNVFVTDDGDGRWALYKATTTGTNATYVKISDPDLLNAVMTASQIAASYEGYLDVQRFTTDLLNKLNTITSGAQVNVIESLVIDGKEVPINSKELSISVDDSVTVNLTGGIMTVKLSDKYKNLIAAAL